MLGKKGRMAGAEDPGLANHALDLEAGSSLATQDLASELQHSQSGKFNNAYILGSSSTDMNLLANATSRRKYVSGGVLGLGPWAEYCLAPINYALDSSIFGGRIAAREFLVKHALMITVALLVFVWYTSAIFAITTSKVALTKVAAPFSLCAAQFSIATLITVVYGFVAPMRRKEKSSVHPSDSIPAASTMGHHSGPGDRTRSDATSIVGTGPATDAGFAMADSAGIGNASGSVVGANDDNDDEEKYGQKARARGPVQLSALASSLFWCSDKRYPYILYQIAVSYTCGFLFTNMAFSVVTTSFAETVKSAEPLSSVVLAYVVLREVESLPTYLCLLPICLGVAISCLHDDSFNLLGFACAAASNVCFSMRAVYAKRLLSHLPKGALDEVTLFGYVSVVGLCLLVPVAMYMEGNELYNRLVLMWDDTEMGTRLRLLLIVVSNGVAYTCYNIMSFLVLTRTNMITHAVLNCVRRVFVIIFTGLFFALRATATNLFGVGIAVLGVIAFAYFKSANANAQNRIKP
jgi:drug/metabolite transporter (DMT)-like permease